jgi:hypothetical protein
VSARVISRHEWRGETFTGWQGTIRANSRAEAEALASREGTVADIVRHVKPGCFAVLVIAN